MKSLHPMILLASAFCLVCSQAVFAQPLSPERMIEQLKNKTDALGPATPAPALRTRSMRNLAVDSSTAQEAVVASERPSLSLQIQFDFNSASIKSDSQQALANLAVALQSKELLEAKFAIEGHTDAKGGIDYNLRLSQTRADAVRTFLAQKGVDATRLAATGKGSSELANKTDPAAAENRRVKIVNLQ